MKNNDKELERNRYDIRSESILNRKDLISRIGSDSIEIEYRTPYLDYEFQIQKYIDKNSKVLELGSGSGMHTEVLLQTNASVTATDISSKSLNLLNHNLGDNYSNLNICVADIENLPFENESFDFITCAGSLSYGNPDLVFSEILRVLKKDGGVIFVDSLNNSFIYKFNRFLHFLKGNRTKSTLNHMPDVQRINWFCSFFKKSNVNYFGSISWMSPILKFFVGSTKTKTLVDSFDNFINVKNSAFKFVLVATVKK